jgi:hypothetical protein
VRKKPKNQLNRENQKTKKPIRIFKKSTGSVRFWFYKPETEKIKPNPNRKKTESNRKNRAKSVFFLK